MSLDNNIIDNINFGKDIKSKSKENNNYINKQKSFTLRENSKSKHSNADNYQKSVHNKKIGWKQSEMEDNEPEL